MSKTLLLPEFMEQARGMVLVDVRSEGEFRQGHFPGAVNLPLLNDEERKIVGTTYKQEGREAAVKKGFELVGHKFSEFIETAAKVAPAKQLAMYCWRGGMRSNTMAWLLDMAGFKVNLLKGGYKVFRNWALEKIKEERNILVLGGKTCSGKTEILHALSKKGEQVIDLEGMAHHKGSSFGALGQLPQPSNEQFENLLAIEWLACDKNRVTWIENESNRIGQVKVPDVVFTMMRKAPVLEVVLSIEKRIERVLNEYAQFSKAELEEGTRRLERRLGNLRMRQAVEMLHNDDLKGWADMLLEYYDDSYEYASSTREKGSVHKVQVEDIGADVSGQIMVTVQKIFGNGK
jgi:tRNA 2-selenouridine synthase